MNCQDFWNQLPARGNDLPAGHTQHLAECPSCAARWEPYRSVATGLEILREEWRREQAPERVEAGLTAAFRVQAGHRRRQSKEPSWWAPVLAWAAAAAAMIALAVVLVRGGWQPSNANPEHVSTPLRTAQPVPEYAAAQSAGDSEDESSVLGDGFVHLPNAPRIEPNEELNVVRFEVPGSTMIALGLDVSEERASQKVLADVALGSDGTARAVRLVSQVGSLEE